MYIRFTQIRLMATIHEVKSFVLSLVSRFSYFSYFIRGRKHNKCNEKQPHQFFWVWAFAHSKMAKRIFSNYYLKYTQIRLEAELLIMISPIIRIKIPSLISLFSFQQKPQIHGYLTTACNSYWLLITWSIKCFGCVWNFSLFILVLRSYNNKYKLKPFQLDTNSD